jgi:hypothetical protein
MNKLIVSFALVFVIFTLIDAFMNGQGGINQTRLTAAMTENQTSATVRSTDGFLAADYIYVEGEKMAYNGKTDTTFTNVVRGVEGIQKAHAVGVPTYSSEAEVLNAMLGYNLISTTTTAGPVAFATTAWNFFTVSIPRLVTWDFSFLQDGYAIYLRYVLMAISMGLTAWVIYQAATAFGGVLQGVLNR